MEKAQDVLREFQVLSSSGGGRALYAQDAITVQDLNGHILAWNPGAERMYGWSETEGLPMNIRDLIPEDRREEALAVLRQLSRAEVIEPYRLSRIAKDGRIVDVWLTATV